jgi:dihydrofolate synthase/folylpolyglutamate synthase
MLRESAKRFVRQIVVIGFAREKSIDDILQMLPREAHYIFTQAAISRAMPAEELAQKAQSAGLQGEVQASVVEAMARARQMASEEDMIFVGGSNFVVAEVL